MAKNKINPALTQLWTGLMLIGFGLIISVPSLITEHYILSFTSFSLMAAGISTLIFSYLLTGKEFSLFKYLTGTILLGAGLFLFVSNQNDPKIVSTLTGGSLLPVSMLVLWLSMLQRPGKSWKDLLMAGFLILALGFLLVLWMPVNPLIMLAVTNGIILILPGYLLIRFNKGMEKWENEIKLEWDRDYHQELKFIRHELLLYHMDLMEIKFSVNSMRNELNVKLSLNDLDPGLLRLSRLLSDLQEDLKTFEQLTEKMSRHIGSKDPIAGLEEKTNIQLILQGLKEQHEEVLREYRYASNLN